MLRIKSKVSTVIAFRTLPWLTLIEQNVATVETGTEHILERTPRKRVAKTRMKTGVACHEMMFTPSFWLVLKAGQHPRADQHNAAMFLGAHGNTLGGAKEQQVIFQQLTGKVVVGVLVAHRQMDRKQWIANSKFGTT